MPVLTIKELGNTASDYQCPDAVTILQDTRDAVYLELRDIVLQIDINHYSVPTLKTHDVLAFKDGKLIGSMQLDLEDVLELIGAELDD